MPKLHDALYASKIVSYAQGPALMRAMSAKKRWNLDLGGIAAIWRGGCIIRARLGIGVLGISEQNRRPKDDRR